MDGGVEVNQIFTLAIAFLGHTVWWELKWAIDCSGYWVNKSGYTVDYAVDGVGCALAVRVSE